MKLIIIEDKYKDNIKEDENTTYYVPGITSIRKLDRLRHLIDKVEIYEDTDPSLLTDAEQVYIKRIRTDNEKNDI